jgi:hypothetical protein
VFHGDTGAGPEAGPGLDVFRLVLRRLGRIPLPHGVHQVDVAG